MLSVYGMNPFELLGGLRDWEHPAYTGDRGTMTVLALWLSNVHSPFQVPCEDTPCLGIGSVGIRMRAPFSVAMGGPVSLLQESGSNAEGHADSAAQAGFLFGPHCRGLASGLLKLCHCLLLQPPFSSPN